MDKNLKDILDTVLFIKTKVEKIEQTVEELPTEKRVQKIVTEAIKRDVPPIVRHEIGELVPGIVALELKPMREQLNEILDRLDTLDEQYTNLKGVTKEIDEIRTEVRAIQNHLGIERKIAA